MTATWHRCSRWLPPALAAALWMVSATAAADPVTVRAAPHEGYGRIVFNWPSPVGFSAERVDNRVQVRFGRPIEATYGGVARALRRYVSAVEPGPDGISVDLVLTGDWGVRSFDLGSAVVVDLLDQTAEPAEAGPAPTAAEAAPVRVRAGEHTGYSRIVFDWPERVDYRVERAPGAATVVFGRSAPLAVQRLRARPPRFMSGFATEPRDDGVAMTLTVAETSQVRHFRAGPRIVIDVTAPAPKAVEPTPPVPEAPPPAPAPAPPVTAEPAPAAPEPQPASEPQPAPEAQPAKPVVLAPPGDRPVAGAEATAPPAAAAEAPTPEAPAGEVSLRFDWDEPVAAAVFRRAGGLWVVFDKGADFDLDALRAAGGNAVRDIRPVPAEGAAALRLDTVSGVNPDVGRDGLAWLLTLRRQPPTPQAVIETRVQPSSPVGPRIFLPVAEPGEAIAVRDPEVGDNLVVVPVIPLGHGIPRAYEYPQLRLLPSVQGVVIRPRIDTLRVRPLRQGIEVTSAGHLQISPVAEDAAVEAQLGVIKPLSRIVPAERWPVVSTNDFVWMAQGLQRAAAVAAEGDRERRRFDLTRFYIANGFAPEALGVLRAIVADRPEAMEDPQFRLLRGAARLHMGRLVGAADDLGHASLDGNDEGAYWRAALRAGSGDLAGAADELQRTGGIMRPYPLPLKMPLGLLMAEAAIEVGDIKHAAHLLDLLSLEGPTMAQQNQIDYVGGRLRELAGDFDGAVSAWEVVEQGPHRPSRARAAVARIELLLKLQSMTRAEAIDEYEQLRFAWRGDDFEFAMLRRLGQLYLDEGDYRNGLRTLRQAATHFRTHPQAADVTQTMSEVFNRLYLDDEADALAPVTAIALYDEFRELTPAGKLGDEMIRRLADRLVGVDLLDRAASLLDSQVQFRLEGAQKARVGARLALIHMLDRKPEQALEVLKASEVTDLPDDLAAQRRQLAGRALSDLDQAEEALALIREDDSLDADLLRADIFWQRRDWANVAAVLRRLLRGFEARPRQPLTEKQGQYVLNLAIALTLSNNEIGVDRVRSDYGAAMDNTVYRDAFRLIASPEAPGLLDYRTIAGKVSTVENFQAFMTAYRERLQAESLSAIN